MNTNRNIFRYRKDRTSLVILLGSAVTVLIGTTIWRGAVFSTDATTTGAPIHSTAANIALGLLATLAFTVAVVAGMSYRRMEPLRVIRKERKKLDEERKPWQGQKDRAERRQRSAEVTLDFLAKREDHILKTIGHRAQERKSRFRHRAAKVAMKELRKISTDRRWIAP